MLVKPNMHASNETFSIYLDKKQKYQRKPEGKSSQDEIPNQNFTFLILT